MIRITIDVEAPTGQAIGIKEDLATYLEKWGDAKVIRIDEIEPEQIKMGANRP